MPLIVLSVLAVTSYQFLPAGLWWDGGGQFAIGLLAAVVVVHGGWRQPKGTRWIWMCFAAGIATHAAGNLALSASLTFTGSTGNDEWWLLLYPFFTVAVVGLIRRRRHGRDRAALIDAFTAATGVAVLTWVAVIGPAVGDLSLSFTHRLVLIAYPLGDIVIIALMTRLLGGSDRNPALLLITTSLGFIAASDLCWVISGLAGIDLMDYGPVYRGVQQLFLVAYWCIALAVRTAGARTVAQPAPPAGNRPYGRRGLLLPTASAMIGPILLWHDAADGRVEHGRAIAVGCAALFLLAAARITVALSQLSASAERMREMARHDDLTKLPNRRAWNEEFGRRLQHSLRTGETVSVCLLDLDHFKVFNDTYGHQSGDDLLADAAGRWSEMLRAGDLLARYGGEEFVVLLTGADDTEATRVLARLRSATPYGQTFSAGVATWDRAETPEAVLSRADQALYRAKNSGRDRIVTAAETVARDTVASHRAPAAEGV